MGANEKAHERRWRILGVLCFSLLVIVLDNSILNVAVPTLARPESQGGLNASNSQLQWMVDSYTLVFAGLLLTAGSLGDRFGRRGALQLGMVIFGVGSIASALADSARAAHRHPRAHGHRRRVHHAGDAVDHHQHLRGARSEVEAIGVWAGVAGVGVALGPLTGGFLLEHFYWGSIFLVNVPIVVVGLLAGRVPHADVEGPDRAPARPRRVRCSRSSASVTLVYAIIEAPDKGWTSRSTLGVVRVSAVVLDGVLPVGAAQLVTRCSTVTSSEPALHRGERGDHGDLLRDVRRRSSC